MNARRPPAATETANRVHTALGNLPMSYNWSGVRPLTTSRAASSSVTAESLRKDVLKRKLLPLRLRFR